MWTDDGELEPPPYLEGEEYEYKEEKENDDDRVITEVEEADNDDDVVQEIGRIEGEVEEDLGRDTVEKKQESTNEEANNRSDDGGNQVE